ncbi:MAG TPA: C45 family peptidase [Chloroflexota bacterium]|jgi:isopenicillin-N N-acyltransferase-like protein|nr:C45 family peptidase [Chloroflexota bacterium]
MRRKADVARLGNGAVLYLKGTPYEQGQQLGRGAADLIRDNIAAADGLVQVAQLGSDLDLSAYQAMTRRNEAWVGRVYPELLDELHGVADGSGIPYSELLHLNLNTDVAYARAYALVMDCTQVLASGVATIDGKTYMAKTRDLTRGPNRHVLLHREFDDGTFRNEFQIAGQMTLPVGVNSWGVAVTTSGQWSRRIVVDLARGDSAWHILNWQPVLRHARSVDEALLMIREQPRVAGMLAMLADSSRCVGLEVTASDIHVFEPEDGLLVRTNHFLSPELRELAPTIEENHGTYDRARRAEELARRGRGAHSVHTLFGILSDHADNSADSSTESICRHAGDGSGGQTYAATVVCPQDKTMWTAFGNPCEGFQAVGQPE